MKRIRNWAISLTIMISAGGALFALATPQTVSAADCTGNFLGIPQWCRNINLDVQITDISGFIWKIVLNVLEMGLWIAGYIAAAFILYGGIQYILTQGAVEGAVKARSTILNGILGLVISMISASVVGFVVTKVLPGTDPAVWTDQSVLKGVLDIVYMASGAFAVIIIILAGFSYTTANGDPAKIAKAKNAIMYAVIGLAVVLIAFLVTQFVIGKF